MIILKYTKGKKLIGSDREGKNFAAEDSVFFPVGEERGTVRGLISSVLCLIFLGETEVNVPTLADLKAKLLPLCPAPRDPDSRCLLFFQACDTIQLPWASPALSGSGSQSHWLLATEAPFLLTWVKIHAAD